MSPDIEELVRTAPPLRPEDVDRLRTLLGYAPSGGGATQAEPAIPSVQCEDPRPGRGHLYVVEFCSGVIKVGRSTKPSGRIAQHARDADVARSWESPEIDDAEDAERRLITGMRGAGHRLRPSREYFTGMTFDEAVTVAESSLTASR